MMLAFVATLLVAEVAFGSHLFAKQDPKASPQQKPNVQLSFGDVVLTPLQKYALNQTGASYNAIIGQKYRWKDGIIPYSIDCSIENNRAAVDAIHKAIAQWERKTCIKFVKWTNEEFHLTFFRDTHCWGHVGQVPYSKISCGFGCEFEHVMAHEIGHVVGLHHEQNRKDRDDWVRVHWENIGQFRDAFDIVQNTDPLGIPYDYESIMHYPWNAFSSNGAITMEPIRPTNGKIPYIEISKDDIELVSRMYDCPAIEKKRKEERLRRRVEKREANVECVDQHEECPVWKNMGHCHVDSVAASCALSCNPACHHLLPTVNPGKPDVDPKKLPSTHFKDGWPNTRYLGKGVLCLDYHVSCEEWANTDQCKINPGYMLSTCMKACKKRGFDVYCDEEIPKLPGECSSPLGLAATGAARPKIPNSAFYSPTYLQAGGGWSAPPYNARLYNDDDFDAKMVGAWCSADHNPGYIQVDMGRRKTFTYIATQGRPKYFERIGTFKIQYGEDPSAMRTYQEDGEDRIFNGNCDHSSPVINQFNEPFSARYIRYVPWQWNFPCLRMELFGC